MTLKLGSKPPKAALNRGTRKEATEDQLNTIRNLAEKARDLDRVIEDQQERLQKLNQERHDIYYNQLPTLMQEANLDSITISAKGNLPAVVLERKPFYSANIAASWPEEKRRKAFDYLIKLKAGDLIKTEVVAQYGRGSLADAKKLAKQLAKEKNVSSTLKETIHSGTLTSWFRDQVENHNFTPNLEIIGASMGYIVKPTQKKGK